MKQRPRNWTDEQLVKVVKESKSYATVIKMVGLIPAGGNYSQIKLHIKRLNLDTSHFTGQGWCTGELHKQFKNKTTTKLDNILVEDSKYTSTVCLKQRLIKAGLLENKCCECGSGPEWLGKTLVLQLDHKDGNRQNNLLSNLRIICPNCHSQTSTFTGRNRANNNPNRKSRKEPRSLQRQKAKHFKLIEVRLKKPKPQKEPPKKLLRPDIEVLLSEIENFGYNQTGRNHNVSPATIKSWIGFKPETPGKHHRKVENRPDLPTLLAEVQELGYVQTGRKYGVSDGAIRKWIKWESKKITPM